jgi:hypothetical protein
MTTPQFLRIILQAITFLQMVAELKVRYYVIISGKSTHNGYEKQPFMPPCEFAIMVEVFFYDQWREIYFYKEDSVENMVDTFNTVLGALVHQGFYFGYNSKLNDLIYADKQKEEKEFQLKKQKDMEAFYESKKKIAEELASHSKLRKAIDKIKSIRLSWNG